jgi:mRNA interferase MazF
MARGVTPDWGEIRLVLLAKPDKTRPALILTRGSAIGYLNAITVAPITRTIRGAPSEILVGTDEGLKQESAVNFDALQTLPKQRIGRYLGSLARHRRRELRSALLFALDLDE